MVQLLLDETFRNVLSKLQSFDTQNDIFDTLDRDPREALLKIDGVEYKFKSGIGHTTNKRFVGYIAQQIESIVPEAVQLIDGKF